MSEIKNDFYYFDQLTKQEKKQLIKVIYPIAGKNGTKIIYTSVLDDETARIKRRIDVKDQLTMLDKCNFCVVNDYDVFCVTLGTNDIEVSDDTQHAYLKLMIKNFGKTFADNYLKFQTEEIMHKFFTIVNREGLARFLIPFNNPKSLYPQNPEFLGNYYLKADQPVILHGGYDDEKLESNFIHFQKLQLKSITELRALVKRVLDEVNVEKHNSNV